MAEIYLTPKQVQAIAAITADNPNGVRLICPPNGFDRSHVEIALLDPEGEVAERAIFTSAGVHPQVEAIPLWWGD